MWPFFTMTLLMFLSAFTTPHHQAQASTQAALDRLGQINTYTPIEPAYSKGSIGFTFGLGFQGRVFDDSNFSNWGNPETYSDHRTESMVSAYLVKGFHGPFDFGVVAGQVLGTTINRIGGHGQWTIYQGFRRPSLAARFSFSRLSGFQGTEVASSQTSLLADYSFLRYFTLFAGYSAQYHHASFQNYIPNWDLSLVNNPRQLTRNWFDQHLSLGFNVKLYSPHINLSAEHQSFESGREQWMAKLSFGI